MASFPGSPHTSIATRRNSAEAAVRPAAILGERHDQQRLFRAKVQEDACELALPRNAVATIAANDAEASDAAVATCESGTPTVSRAAAVANGAAITAASGLLQSRRHSLEACFRTLKFQPRRSLLSATAAANPAANPATDNAAVEDASRGNEDARPSLDCSPVTPPRQGRFNSSPLANHYSSERGSSSYSSRSRSANRSAAFGVSTQSRGMANGATNVFDAIPDDVLVDIFAALGSARHVAAAGAVCRRWFQLVPSVPLLAFTRLALSPAKIEEVVSRMVLRSQALSALHVETVVCGGSSGNTHPREFIVEAWARHAGSSLRHVTFTQHKAVLSARSSAGSSAAPSCTVYAGGPDFSCHLHHLASHCSKLSSMRLGSFTLPPHSLRGLSAFPHLRTLSLEWTSLAASTLQSLLDACPNLRHLSIFMAAGLTAQTPAYPAGFQGARYGAAIAGPAGLCLRLPAHLETVELAYLRVSAVTLICSGTPCTEDNLAFRGSACRSGGGGCGGSCGSSSGGLRAVSIRDMFLSSLSLPNAYALESLTVATAASLRISAPASSALESLEVRAGTVHWPSLEALVAASGASLKHLALDFFTVGCVGDAQRASATVPAGKRLDLFNLTWLIGHCPNISSLSLGPLPWECLIRGGSFAHASGSIAGDFEGGSAVGGSEEGQFSLGRVMNPADVAVWPSQLESLSVKLRGRSGATLLWIGAFLRQCEASLTSVKVLCLEDEEGEEEYEDEEEDEERDEDDDQWDEYDSEIEEEWDEEGREESEGSEWGDEDEEQVEMRNCGYYQCRLDDGEYEDEDEEWDSEDEEEDEEEEEEERNEEYGEDIPAHSAHSFRQYRCQQQQRWGNQPPVMRRTLCSTRGGGGSYSSSSSTSTLHHRTATTTAAQRPLPLSSRIFDTNASRTTWNSALTSRGSSALTSRGSSALTSRGSSTRAARSPHLDSPRQRLIAGRAFFSSALDALQRAYPHVDILASC